MARWTRTAVAVVLTVALSPGLGCGPAGAAQGGGTSRPEPPGDGPYEVVWLPVQPEPGTAAPGTGLPWADTAAEQRLAEGAYDDPGPVEEATVPFDDHPARNRGAGGAAPGRAAVTMLADTTALIADYAFVDVFTLDGASAAHAPTADAIVATGHGHLQLRSARPDDRPRIAVAYASRAGAPPRPWSASDRVADVVMSVEGPDLRLIDLGMTVVDVPWHHPRGRYRCTVYRTGADRLLATDVEEAAVGVEQWLLVFSPSG